MITTNGATTIDGRTIAGQTFLPADGDSAHAVFSRNGRCCGITYEMGRVHPYLRCAPGYMLPPRARNKKTWTRMAWAEKEDRLLEIKIDENDGELTYFHNDKIVGEEPERCIEDAVDFLLSDDFHDFVVKYVATCLRTKAAC